MYSAREAHNLTGWARLPAPQHIASLAAFMNNQPIGVLDSGVGGLTIWKEIISLLSHESTIYLADSQNCPYGSRPETEIYQLSKRLVQFLLDNKCKLIVLACNTITVSCLLKLRKEFPQAPIIGTVPVVKTAAALSKNKKIGILSTTRTAESAYQKNLIKRFAGDCTVINIGTDKLVPLIEKGDKSSVLPKELYPFKKASIDVLVLGCSHFPLIKDEIQKALGSKVHILDSGRAIARQVKRVLLANNALSETSKPSHRLLTTGDKNQLKMTFRKLMRYNTAISIRKIDL